MPEKTFDFVNRGVVLKLQTGALQLGQLMSSTNISSEKEASINARPGSRRYLGNNVPNWLTPHSLSKLSLGKGDVNDPRYVGEQSNIWRVTGPYSNDVLISAGLGLGSNPNARWESAAYNSGSSGNPFMFFAHPVRSMKDDGSFPVLRRWGIPPPVIPPTVTISGSVSNGPNGDYKYLYIFRNPQTGAMGNPCALAPTAITAANQSINVKFWGADLDPITGDPALAGLGSIAIYRSGGAFADALYRFVGFAENPGYTAGLPDFDNFVDAKGDLDIADADTIEFDNDMPVTSDLPVPFVGQIQALTAVGVTSFTKVFLNNWANYGFGLSIAWSPPNPQGFFTPGSQVTIGTGDNQEVCIVFAVDQTTGIAPHWIEVALQNSHSTGEQVFCDAIAGVPCDLVCQYQDAILLAGDPNNPHKVYRSKSGRPDAFPVVDLQDGNAHVLNVGSPSNPVYGFVEFDGEMVCLNQKSIPVFIVLNGAMSPPQNTPSDRGMVAKNCFCKVKNEIWFLSYDGIYSWAGGSAQLRSEAIHSVFNSQTSVIADQTYYQIDYTRLNAFYIECIDQEMWLHYFDIKGNQIVWRYQFLYDRWLPVVINSAVSAGIGAMMTEKDTGRFIVGIQDNAGSGPAAYLQQFLVGFSESWITNENEGDPIEWGFQTGFVAPEERTRTLQFNELVVEVLNPVMSPGDFINFNLSYDYADSLDPVDDFQITTPNGKRVFVTFPLQQSSIDGTAEGKEAMAVSLTVRGNTHNAATVFSWTLRYNPLQIPVKNSILDWQSLGSPNDKQLYCLALEFDPHGQQVTLLLDIIAGVPGAQVPQVQDFTLQPAVWTQLQIALTALAPTMTLLNPANVSVGMVLQIEDELVFVTGIVGTVATVTRGYLGTAAAPHAALPDDPVYSLGRVKQVFPIVDNVITKAVRLRSVIPEAVFEIFNWNFEPIEQYPPDIVYFSELTDSGSPFLKYYNQVSLSVDTGGVEVTVGLELDGSIAFTFPVKTDRFTRYQNFTCPGQLTGVNARILPQLPLPPGAKFQLWPEVVYQVQPADKGPVVHSTDWNDLGTQFDKQLQTITFEYDGSAGDIDMQIEELTGIHGDVPTPGITFHLSGSARGKQEFAFPDGHIAKMVRVHPASTPEVPLSFRSWTYSIGKIDFPPDFILFTDLSDNGSPYLKFFNQIVLEVDTGGQPVVVLLELDGIIVWEFTVTATRKTRRQAFVCPSQLSGINARILIKYPQCLGVGS